MSARSRLRALIRTIFRQARLDADLHDEVGAYVDELTERHVNAGLDRDSARRAAMIETGGIEQVKERVREVRAGSGIDTWLKDVVYALRGLRRSPGFTAVAVLTLALGVGANTAIFSVVDAVLLRPAPVADLDRLVMLWETDRVTGTVREPASVPDFLDFRARARSVAPVVALAAGEVNLTPVRGEPRRLAALRVSPDLLPMLGLRPIIGRHFREEDGRVGGPATVLISESLWAALFDRRRDALGAVIRLNDVSFTVAGVVPDASDFGVLQVLGAAAYSRAFADRGDAVRVDVWLPHQPDPNASPRATHPILMLGKLAPGRSPGAAQQEFTSIAADLERSYASNHGRGIHVEALADVVFGPVRPALALLVGAVALVFLVACVNVANLLLARGSVRAHEVAVRMALGAGIRRLLRQFVIENVVLCLIAGSAGVMLAYGGLAALVALAPSDVPRLSTIGVDLRVLAVGLAVSVLVGLAFGLLPALQARRIEVAASLAEHGGVRQTGSRRLSGRRGALVVAEVALAVMLMAGAGLLVHSLWNLEGVETGFRAGGVVKAEFQLPGSRYPAKLADFPNFKEIHAFDAGVLRRAAALPGVEAVAVAGNHPLDPGFTNSFTIVGREAEASTYPEISIRRVSAGYFRTVGLPLMRGRLLEERDGTTAPPVLLINEAAARRFFPGRDPLGARIRFWGADRTIVGVVSDERSHGLDTPPPMAAYTPLAQTPSVNGAGVLLARTSGDPGALVPALRRVIREQDPQLAVFGVEPLVRTVGRSLAVRRFVALLLTLFAVLALFLAAVGIHGVLAYGVAQRQREFGIRMALGARRLDVVRSVLLDALALVVAGLSIGLAGALLTAPLISAQLFGVTPHDPVTFGAALGFLTLVALVSSVIPAWRATKVDPVAALRAE